MGVSVNPLRHGDVVQIPDGYDIDPNQARADVKDLFKYSQDRSEEMLDEFFDRIDDIQDLLKKIRIPDFVSIVGRIATDKVNFPKDLNLAELILSTAYPDAVPIKPILKQVEAYDFTYHEPIPPEKIEASFNWTGERYISQLRPQLIQNIYNDLVNGGNGLNSVVYDAILQRERQKRLRNQSTALRDALHSVGANGCRLPDGATAGVLAEIYKSQGYQDQEAQNLITEKDFDIAQRNKEFSHTLALEIDKVASGEWDAWETRRFEAAKAIFDLDIAMNENAIRIYESRVKGEISRIQAGREVIEAVIAENKGLIDMYQSEWDGYKAQVEAVGSENASKVQIRGMTIDNWWKQVQAAATKQGAEIDRKSFDWKQIIEDANLKLATHQANIDGYKSEVNLQNTGLNSIAQIMAQIAASMLGIMNASASEGFSGSESVGMSHGVSRSLGESYSGEIV